MHIGLTRTLVTLSLFAFGAVHAVEAGGGAPLINKGDRSSSPPQVAASGFQYVLGDTLYPYSTQAEPGKGQSYLDTTYHTTITRITDIDMDNPAIKAQAAANDGYGVGTGYPTWNPINSARDRLIFYGISSDQRTSAYGYQLYDANTYAFIEDLAAGRNSSPLAWWNDNDPEPRWDRSGQHPYRLFYRRNMQLRYFDTDTLAEGLVHNFCNEFGPGGTIASLGTCATDATEINPGVHYILTHEYGSPDVSSRYWAYEVEHIVDSSGSTKSDYIFVYDRTLDKVISSHDISAAPKGMKGILTSPDGQYVMVNYWYVTGANTEFDGPHIYKWDFSSNVKATTDIPHSNWAYDAQGHLGAFMLNDNYITFTRADTGAYYLLYNQANLGWNGSNLLTSYQQQHGWGFFSNYGDPGYNTVYWDDSQIFAIEIDESKCISWSPSVAAGGATNTCAGTPRIWRVSYTQNWVDSSYYYQQPNAQMDYEGTTIWWGANWRSPESVHQVYQIKLPPTWQSDLAVSGLSPTSTTLALTAGTNPAAAGASLTFTAIVTSPNPGTPSGAVTFMDGATALGTGTAGSPGSWTFTSNTLAAGLHSITAVYSGDSSFATSTSTAFAEVMESSSGGNSVTTLTVTVNGVPVTAPVYFGVVKGAAGAQGADFVVNVTGSVNGDSVVLLDGNKQLGPELTLTAGSQSYQTQLPVGQHGIQAVYVGNGSEKGSASSIVIVNRSPRPVPR